MSTDFQDALHRAEAARAGDSTDAEVDAVWAALEVARPLIQAGQDAAGLFADPWFAYGVGRAMTCAEADTIERWLRLSTSGQVADTWLAGHAVGDDDPHDDHHLDQFDHIPATQWPSWVHLVAEHTPTTPAGAPRTATTPNAAPTPNLAAASTPTRGRAT